MNEIRKINEDFRDAFKKGFEKVVPKVGATGYRPGGGFGGFISNAPKEDLEKLHFIGYVKFLQDEMNKGHSRLGRAGRVTDEDLKRYDDYKAWYDEYMADLEDAEGAEYENEYMEESISEVNKQLGSALNEISDVVADKVTDKRIANRAKAVARDIVKPNKKTGAKARDAVKKAERNAILSSDRDFRHGVINTKEGRFAADKYFAMDKDKRPESGTVHKYSKQLDKEIKKLEKED